MAYQNQNPTDHGSTPTEDWVSVFVMNVAGEPLSQDVAEQIEWDILEHCSPASALGQLASDVCVRTTEGETSTFISIPSSTPDYEQAFYDSWDMLHAALERAHVADDLEDVHVFAGRMCLSPSPLAPGQNMDKWSSMENMDWLLDDLELGALGISKGLQGINTVEDFMAEINSSMG